MMVEYRVSIEPTDHSMFSWRVTVTASDGTSVLRSFTQTRLGARWMAHRAIRRHLRGRQQWTVTIETPDYHDADR